MNGPYESGTFQAIHEPSELSWENSHLKRGDSYRVIEPFTDADGDEHHVGEEWEFIVSMFSRFHDELTICVRTEVGEEWKIPLVWKPSQQQGIIEGFSKHVCEVTCRK